MFVIPDVLGQGTAPLIPVRKLNSFEIRVSDLDRSLVFYQELFGMPLQSRSDRLCLRIGEGPQFMALRQVLPGEVPGITQIGYGVEDYAIDTVLAGLLSLGYVQISPPPLSAQGLDNAMKCWIRSRGETLELYFADARGLIVQLSDPAYCGGGGLDGDLCAVVEAVPAGLMALTDINHFTVFVNGGDVANTYYQDTFGLSVQSYQGPNAPVTGIGDGFQFVMYAGALNEAQPSPANIHHGCFNMSDFDVEQTLQILTDYGLTARGDNTLGPLMHYVSLRMPNRGGAEGGTPELYFTDPDGILLQLQDSSYCGGGGYLGNECLPG